jgi:fatty acid desaturase
MNRLTGTDESPQEPSAWLFWPRFLMFPLLAVVTYPAFLLGWGGDVWWVQAAWVVFLAYCWFCIGGSFHEAAHQTLFRNPALNLWYGRVLGLLMGIPYTAYRESHRRHHAYLNTSADYELWPYCDPRCSLAFRRLFVWVDLVFGVITAPVIYTRIYFVNDPRLPKDARRQIGWELLASALYYGLTAAAFAVWAVRTGWDWGSFDPVWLLPLVLAPMFNTARKFVEHLGLGSTDPFLGTRTVIGGNALSRLFSYFNFDLAIHGPHHRFPRAQHFELEQKFQALRQPHEAQQSIPLFSSYRAALWDVAPKLWTNPATGGAALSPAISADEPVPWEAADAA